MIVRDLGCNLTYDEDRGSLCDRLESGAVDMHVALSYMADAM